MDPLRAGNDPLPRSRQQPTAADGPCMRHITHIRGIAGKAGPRRSDDRPSLAVPRAPAATATRSGQPQRPTGPARPPVTTRGTADHHGNTGTPTTAATLGWPTTATPNGQHGSAHRSGNAERPTATATRECPPQRQRGSDDDCGKCGTVCASATRGSRRQHGTAAGLARPPSYGNAARFTQRPRGSDDDCGKCGTVCASATRGSRRQHGTAAGLARPPSYGNAARFTQRQRGGHPTTTAT